MLIFKTSFATSPTSETRSRTWCSGVCSKLFSLQNLFIFSCISIIIQYSFVSIIYPEIVIDCISTFNHLNRVHMKKSLLFSIALIFSMSVHSSDQECSESFIPSTYPSPSSVVCAQLVEKIDYRDGPGWKLYDVPYRERVISLLKALRENGLKHGLFVARILSYLVDPVYELLVKNRLCRSRALPFQHCALRYDLQSIPFPVGRDFCRTGCFRDCDLVGKICIRDEKTIGNISCSPCGRYISSLLSNGNVRIDCIKNGEVSLLGTAKSNGSPVTAFCWNKDGSILAVGSEDGGVEGLYVELLGFGLPYHCCQDSVKTLAFNPKDGELAVGYPSRVCFLDMDCICLEVPLPRSIHFEGELDSLCFSHDGEFLAIGADELIKVFAVKTLSLLFERGLRFNEDYFLNWHPDGSKLTCGSFENEIEFLDTSTWNELGTLGVKSRGVLSACWNSDGSMLASTHNDSTVRVWDMKSARLLHEFHNIFGMKNICWSPCGCKLYVGVLPNCVAKFDIGKQRDRGGEIERSVSGSILESHVDNCEHEECEGMRGCLHGSSLHRFIVGENKVEMVSFAENAALDSIFAGECEILRRNRNDITSKKKNNGKK